MCCGVGEREARSEWIDAIVCNVEWRERGERKCLCVKERREEKRKKQRRKEEKR